MQCYSGDCRPAAAKESAERARFFRGSDDARQEWNQFFAVRLMQIIAERALQIAVIAGCECGRNCTCTCTIFDGGSPPDS